MHEEAQPSDSHCDEWIFLILISSDRNDDAVLKKADNGI
jgi:hypothetical protein